MRLQHIGERPSLENGINVSYKRPSFLHQWVKERTLSSDVIGMINRLQTHKTFFFRFYVKKSDEKRHLAIMNFNVLIILRPLYSFFSEGERYIWYLTYELKLKGGKSKEKRQLISLYKHNVHVLQKIFKEFLFSSDLEILKWCSSLIMSTPAKT